MALQTFEQWFHLKPDLLDIVSKLCPLFQPICPTFPSTLLPSPPRQAAFLPAVPLPLVSVTWEDPGRWKSRKAEEGRWEKPDGSQGWQGEGGPQWQTPWRDGVRWRPKRRGRGWPLMGCFWPFTVSSVKWWREKTVAHGWGVVRRETETKCVEISGRSKGKGRKIQLGRTQGRRSSRGILNIFMAEDGIKPLMEKGNSDTF